MSCSFRLDGAFPSNIEPRCASAPGCQPNGPGRPPAYWAQHFSTHSPSLVIYHHCTAQSVHCIATVLSCASRRSCPCLPPGARALACLQVWLAMSGAAAKRELSQVSRQEGGTVQLIWPPLPSDAVPRAVCEARRSPQRHHRANRESVFVSFCMYICVCVCCVCVCTIRASIHLHNEGHQYTCTMKAINTPAQ